MEKKELKFNEYFTNEYGNLVFINKSNPYLFAERPYHWQDRVIFLDESTVDSNGRRERTVKTSKKFSDFYKEMDDWYLMDPKIHKRCLKNYSEHIKHNREFVLMDIISG